MKCKNCRSEKIRILGNDYCPRCSKKNFDIKKHANVYGFDIREESARAVLWGVAVAFLSTVIIAAVLRTFFSSYDIPTFIILILGFICFGFVGFITKHFDFRYYLFDNFIISVILSIIVSVVDLYLASGSYIITFFSSLIVFFITISLGSTAALFFNKRGN